MFCEHILNRHNINDIPLYSLKLALLLGFACLRAFLITYRPYMNVMENQLLFFHWSKRITLLRVPGCFVTPSFQKAAPVGQEQKEGLD